MHDRVAQAGRRQARTYIGLCDIDHDGEELPDKHAAWREATVTAGQIMQDIDGKLQPGKAWRMEVTDEFANPLYVIHVYAEKAS